MGLGGLAAVLYCWYTHLYTYLRLKDHPSVCPPMSYVEPGKIALHDGNGSGALENMLCVRLAC